MAKVFLDIGAHTGETLEVVQAPRWGFDSIHSFEPAPACWPEIERRVGPRTHLHRFGLWSRDEVIPLYGAGAIGASVSAEKEGSDAAVDCEFRDAATWFEENLDPDDEIYAKVNVEGAEVELIGRLHEAGALHLVGDLLIHFDVRKVPSRAHLEGEVRGWLDDARVRYVPADEIQFGGVYRGTRNWLAWCHSGSRLRDLRHRRLARAEHAVRLRLWPLKVAVLRRMGRATC